VFDVLFAVLEHAGSKPAKWSIQIRLDFCS
jgi:hypothetical protein